MNILCLLPHPIESPGPRFRVFQYLPYFKQAGINYKVSSFLNDHEYMDLYNTASASMVKKSSALIKGTARQISQMLHVKSYDAVLIYREAILWGKPWIEKYIVECDIPLIYDFDDAIWLPVKSHLTINPFIKRLLKSQTKFDEIIRLSDHVMAGNSYLAKHAADFNKNVSVVPTVVDTDYYKPVDREKGQNISIGWIGSMSTSPYLELLNNIWGKLPDGCELRIVGGTYIPEGIKTANIKWQLNTELSEIVLFDIGIMPLSNDEWTSGKCGLKAIQYMAMGLPVVASPVGVNTEIIQDGVNGFLAKDEKEWVEKLMLLIVNPALRKKIGAAGRKTVEEKYSVKILAPEYLRIIKDVINKNTIKGH